MKTMKTQTFKKTTAAIMLGMGLCMASTSYAVLSQGNLEPFSTTPSIGTFDIDITLEDVYQVNGLLNVNFGTFGIGDPTPAASSTPVCFHSTAGVANVDFVAGHPGSSLLRGELLKAAGSGSVATEGIEYELRIFDPAVMLFGANPQRLDGVIAEAISTGDVLDNTQNCPGNLSSLEIALIGATLNPVGTAGLYEDVVTVNLNP